MKNLLCLSLIGLILGVGACKKDLCANINCGTNGHCDDGVCICDSGYSGTHCEVFDSCYNVSCGVHGHCVSGTCVCDSGWAGQNCNEIACHYSHTGSVYITSSNTHYTYHVFYSGEDFGRTYLNDGALINELPVGSVNLTFRSEELCYSSGPLPPPPFPCSIKYATIVINECQEVIYTIPW